MIQRQSTASRRYTLLPVPELSGLHAPGQTRSDHRGDRPECGSKRISGMGPCQTVPQGHPQDTNHTSVRMCYAEYPACRAFVRWANVNLPLCRWLQASQRQGISFQILPNPCHAFFEQSAFKRQVSHALFQS